MNNNTQLSENEWYKGFGERVTSLLAFNIRLILTNNEVELDSEEGSNLLVVELFDLIENYFGSNAPDGAVTQLVNDTAYELRATITLDDELLLNKSLMEEKFMEFVIDKFGLCDEENFKDLYPSTHSYIKQVQKRLAPIYK